MSYQILEQGTFDNAFDQLELLGFALQPLFDLVDAKEGNEITARQLKKYTCKMISISGYYVCRKDVRTVNKKHMYFGTWLDKEGHFFDTTHFPPSLKRSPFRGKGCYLIKGRVVLDFGFPSIEVLTMEKLPYVKDDRFC